MQLVAGFQWRLSFTLRCLDLERINSGELYYVINLAYFIPEVCQKISIDPKFIMPMEELEHRIYNI